MNCAPAPVLQKIQDNLDQYAMQFTQNPRITSGLKVGDSSVLSVKRPSPYAVENFVDKVRQTPLSSHSSVVYLLE